MWWLDYQLKKFSDRFKHSFTRTHCERSVGFNQWQCMFGIELCVCVWCLLMEWIYVWCLPLKWKFESCTKCNSIYNTVFGCMLGITLRVNDLCFNRNSFDRYRLHRHTYTGHIRRYSTQCFISIENQNNEKENIS